MIRMKTELLYLDNSYLKECEATVIGVVNEKQIMLDKTVFYAQGGGQPFDTGTLMCSGESYKVTAVKKSEGNVFHEVDHAGLKVGDRVTCSIDWQRRYTFMRVHTAMHILSSVFHNKTGALISGNQIDLEKSRIDFTLENFDRDQIQQYAQHANELIKQNKPIKVYSMKRDEALKIPSVVKLAGALPPQIDILRIVEIQDIDVQADGGTHVKNTSEIGEIEILSVENKGKANRRVYFKLKE